MEHSFRTSRRRPRDGQPVTDLAPAFDWNGVGRNLLLIHLVLSPILFSHETAETFEIPKTMLTILTGLALSAMGLAALVRRWRERPARAWGGQLASLLREPVAGGMALFLLSAVLSTVFSVSPRTS